MLKKWGPSFNFFVCGFAAELSLVSFVNGDLLVGWLFLVGAVLNLILGAYSHNHNWIV